MIDCCTCVRGRAKFGTTGLPEREIKVGLWDQSAVCGVYMSVVCVWCLLLIKHSLLPWVVLLAVGIQLGSISGDTVSIITHVGSHCILFTILQRYSLIAYVYLLLQLI